MGHDPAYDVVILTYCWLRHPPHEVQAMRLPRLQFTIRRFMIVVVVSALILTPFAWALPELRWPLLTSCLTFALFVLVVASPFLIEGLEGGGPAFGPGGTKLKPLTRLLRIVPWRWPVLLVPWRWPEPPHRRKPTRDLGDSLGMNTGRVRRSGSDGHRRPRSRTGTGRV